MKVCSFWDVKTLIPSSVVFRLYQTPAGSHLVLSSGLWVALVSAATGFRCVFWSEFFFLWLTLTINRQFLCWDSVLASSGLWSRAAPCGWYLADCGNVSLAICESLEPPLRASHALQHWPQSDESRVLPICSSCPNLFIYSLYSSTLPVFLSFFYFSLQPSLSLSIFILCAELIC